ncbi:natriuretic peptides A [Brienomyrus brachyistius]|uniref:natriuretic peptides A n=1 Tax=Brienomyrus brachyistius TaxID=42636 RepID=UPI0020B2549C|nr:natriuretic peptides A [Brienomyrus brachyistius]
MRIMIACGILVLLCQQVLVNGHVLGRAYAAADLARLKNLLEQFEETLAGEEAAEGASDYQDGRLDPEQSPTGPEWTRDKASQGTTPEDAFRAQRNLLQDLLMSTRSKSACFGGRIDRIGTSSGLGCSPKRG